MVGFKVVNSKVVGSKVVDSKAVGSKVVGSKVVGSIKVKDWVGISFIRVVDLNYWDLVIVV